MNNKSDMSDLLEYINYQFPASIGHFPLKDKIDKIESNNLKIKNILIELRDAYGNESDGHCGEKDCEKCKAWDKVRDILA